MDPELADDALFSDLDREVRARLRTLSKENAESVGRHLVMVGRLLDLEPEAAYQHAQAAVRRAGRVDVVREAAGIAAYRTARYAEALRELRTVRRLSGSADHLALMADAERGLGRPERALTLAAEPEAETLPAAARVELAIVVSGARLDLGDPDSALAALATPVVRAADGLLAVRVAQARATALEAAGRPDEARELLARYTEDELADSRGDVDLIEEVVVFDLEDEPADEDPARQDGVAPDDGPTDGGAPVSHGGPPERDPVPDGDPVPALDPSDGAAPAGGAVPDEPARADGDVAAGDEPAPAEAPGPGRASADGSSPAARPEEER